MIEDPDTSTSDCIHSDKASRLMGLVAWEIHEKQFTVSDVVAFQDMLDNHIKGLIRFNKDNLNRLEDEISAKLRNAFYAAPMTTPPPKQSFYFFESCRKYGLVKGPQDLTEHHQDV